MSTANEIFTQDQRDLLTAVLNRIVPADDRFPGAGDLGGAAFVERAVGNTLRLRRRFGDGLTRIEIAAAGHGDTEFPALSATEQDDILRQVESEYPAFFNDLVRQCYNFYYTNPEIFDLIGYSMPAPEDYKPLPFDESLLEPVRQRGQIWRSV